MASGAVRKNRSETGEARAVFLVQRYWQSEGHALAQKLQQAVEVTPGAYAGSAEECDGDIATPPGRQKVRHVFHPTARIAMRGNDDALYGTTARDPGARRVI